MDANDYQLLSVRTLVKEPGFKITDDEVMVLWCAMGLAGESGKFCDNVKKIIFHRHSADFEKLKSELGDVLWYIAGLCEKLGFNMADVMAYNIDKLRRRYPDGFSTERSYFRDGADVK